MVYELLVLASGLVSTTYGYNEIFCGDVHRPEACAVGAVTASGVPFDPSLPQIALAAPSNLRIRPTWVGIRVQNGPCVMVHLVDKMNPRYVGVRGMDLTPAAVALVTGKPAHPKWSGEVFVCDFRQLRVESFRGGNVAPALRDPYVPIFIDPFTHMFRISP
jgi:hypothetical protein